MNFDFHMRYNQLDLWARYQDFQLRIRNAIAKRQALDFIMAGFNGISRAATSDRAKTRCCRMWRWAGCRNTATKPRRV